MLKLIFIFIASFFLMACDALIIENIGERIPICTQDLTRCVDDTSLIETCISEEWVSSQCDDNTLCQEQDDSASCVETITCADGETRCNNGNTQVEICSNNIWRVNIACTCQVQGNGASCVETITCTDGETRCDSTNTQVETCTSNIWNVSSTCVNTEACEEQGNSASCVETIICTDGETRCDSTNTQVETCTSNIWNVSSTCVNTEACEEQGNSANCVETIICTDGETRCDSTNTQVETCTSNIWNVSNTCVNTEACEEQGNSASCVETIICTDDETRCDSTNTQVETCTSNIWNVSNTCVNTEACEEQGNSASCVETITCTDGETRCDSTNTQVEICTSNIWNVNSTCMNTEACEEQGNNAVCSVSGFPEYYSCEQDTDCSNGLVCIDLLDGFSATSEHKLCLKDCTSDLTICGADNYCEDMFIPGQNFCWAKVERNSEMCFGNHSCKNPSNECLFNSIFTKSVCKDVCNGALNGEQDTCNTGETCFVISGFVAIQKDAQGNDITCTSAEDITSCDSSSSYTCQEVSISAGSTSFLCARPYGLCGLESSIYTNATALADKVLEDITADNYHLCDNFTENYYCSDNSSLNSLTECTTLGIAPIQTIYTNELGYTACTTDTDCSSISNSTCLNNFCYIYHTCSSNIDCFRIGGECYQIDENTNACTRKINTCVTFCEPNLTNASINYDCPTGQSCVIPQNNFDYAVEVDENNAYVYCPQGNECSEGFNCSDIEGTHYCIRHRKICSE